MVKLVLLGTPGCHLCEQAEDIMTACAKVEVESIDIAEQQQWQEKYAIRIPVLYHAETGNELGWPFDLANVNDFINELSDD